MPFARGDPERVQVHVRVREREPELVLGDAEQDRVVQDPPVGAGDEDVLALVDRALVEVARDDHVREVERVRALDLDLLLDADVPQRDAVHEVPVLGDRVAVVAGVVRVVVDAVARDPVLAGRVEVRRLADPRVEQDPRVVVHRSCCSPFLRDPAWRPRHALSRSPFGSHSGSAATVAARRSPKYSTSTGVPAHRQLGRAGNRRRCSARPSSRSRRTSRSRPRARRPGSAPCPSRPRSGRPE